VLLILFVGSCIGQQYPATFGTAIAQGTFLAGQENALFSHQGKGALTYFWAVEYAPDSMTSDTIFRYYADDNDPIEFTAGLIAGIGFEDDTSPWGTPFSGKGASNGAVFSTLRVPFQKSIRITGELPSYQKSSVMFWWITRGVDNIPTVIGGYTLPDGAYLKLYKNENFLLKPHQYLPLVKTNKNGAVWMITLAIQSGNLRCLEGCMRMFHGNSPTPMLLSSGTEDYFQSAYYFNAGKYYFPEAGCTHLNETGVRISAYKIHDRDSLFFLSGGFSMAWRNGDMVDPGTGQKCVDSGNPAGNPTNSIITSYAWVYEWD